MCLRTGNFVRASQTETRTVKSCNGIFEALLPSFKEVAKQDDSEAVMKNVQTIYAGLTYGRGTLNETIDSGADANRGFEA